MNKTRTHRVVKGTSFLLILCLIVSYISCLLVNPETDLDLRHYQYIRGFFEEPTGSLDAVFIGASNVYSSWVAPIAWERYGLRIRSLTSAGLGGDSFKAIIQNIYDRHPNVIYIVSMNSFLSKTNMEAFHDYLDYWPVLYKPNLLLSLCEEGVIASSDILEYSAPLIRFHNRWTQLKDEDFHHGFNGLKGSSIYPQFFEGCTDVSDGFYITNRREELDADALKVLTDFLEYCKESDIQILFVGVPWAAPENWKERLNYVSDIISDEGFPVINLSNHLQDIKLDSKQDYYDEWHTNIHGALKITDYLSQYLLAHYDFPEKAGGVL